jgi:peptidoglycan/xylan/chitin deacetylase (PgdA/CDA1 family)
VTSLDRRATLLGLSALALAPQAALAQVQTVALPRPARAHGLVSLNQVRTDRAEVALTFDDGPHPQHTPLLLDILAARRQRATFYVIGRLVERFPDIVRRMVAEGHEVANHTWSHPTLSSLGDAGVLREIDRTQEVIWRVTGHVPTTMRPPYGAFTARQSRMLAEARNLPTIIWSVDPQDWRRPGPQVVADRMVRGAQPGAIILAHDIHAPTIRAVPPAIDGLIARGLTSVTLSELLGWGRWGPGARPIRTVDRNRENNIG